MNLALLGEASSSLDVSEVMGWVTSVAPIMKIYPINIFIGIGIVSLVIGLIVVAVRAFKH